MIVSMYSLHAQIVYMWVIFYVLNPLFCHYIHISLIVSLSVSNCFVVFLSIALLFVYDRIW